MITVVFFASLREEGYRGTTAREIAARSGSNQSAIYYHFGGIDELVLAALLQSSASRLDRYREALAVEHDLVELVDTLSVLHAEDTATGHLAVMTEVAGGITASPSLRSGIADATDPWLAFVQAQIEQAVARLPMGSLVPAAQLSDLIFSLVLGVELRNRVDGRTDRFQTVLSLARLAVNVLPLPSNNPTESDLEQE